MKPSDCKLLLIERLKGPLDLFRCECGTVKKIYRNSIFPRGNTKSCGCLNNEVRHRPKKHGKTGSPEYKVWADMLNRCNNKKSVSYPSYGGRGIVVCERWQDSSLFLEDMGQRPSAIHTLDRRDNDGPYCKSNCRWATPTEQAYNRRNNVLWIHAGEALPVKQWSMRTGIPLATLVTRRFNGWSVERALTTPVRINRRYHPKDRL